MNDLIEFRLKAAEERLKEQDAELQAVKRDLEEFEKAEAAKERKALMWGIITLGSIVMSLGGIIWTYRSVIFK